MLTITLAPIICIVAMAAICIVQIRTADANRLAYEREKARADLAEEHVRFTNKLLLERIKGTEDAFLEAGFEREKGKINEEV